MQEMQETQVQSLCGKDPQEEEMAIHSSILAWKNPTDRGALQAIVCRAEESHHNGACTRTEALCLFRKTSLFR